eukprot:gb/GEZN01000142.1/.p1 GENE.gb/GEZN01000142.1/~~gb/GEZN01000142.1/.p1  ORF type:complete len:1985 (+),score=306.96 gb/GEZN01000142.1/:58-6012(+)
MASVEPPPDRKARPKQRPWTKKHRIEYDPEKPVPTEPGWFHNFSVFFSQFLALLKKNFLLKGRDWQITSTEFLVPIIVMLAFLGTIKDNENTSVPAMNPSPEMLNQISPPYRDQFRWQPRNSDFSNRYWLDRSGPEKPDVFFEAMGAQNYTAQERSKFCKEQVSYAENKSQEEAAMTLVEMVACGYAFAISPKNSTASLRLYELLVAFDPIWEMGVEFYDNPTELEEKLESRNYDQEKFFVFAVDFSNQGPDWQYQLMGNTTTGSINQAGPYKPRLPQIHAQNQFAKYSDDWRTYGRGFIQLQYLIDNFVIMYPEISARRAAEYWIRWLVRNETIFGDRGDLEVLVKEENVTWKDVEHYLIPRPYVLPLASASYIYNQGLESMGSSYGTLFAASLIWCVTRIAKTLIEEKEERILQGLMMMGTLYASIWNAWFWFYSVLFMLMSVVIVLPSCLSNSGVFTHTKPGMVFLMFWFMCMATFSFSFAWSSLFDKARMGMAIVAMLFFVAQLVNEAVNPDSMPSGAIAVICFIPNVAFSQGIQAILNVEKYSQGLNFQNWNESNNNWSAALSFLMLVVDVILWIIIGLYWDSIIQKDFGVALPWYYPVSPTYWKHKLGLDQRSEGKSQIPDQPDYTVVYEGASKPAVVEELSAEQFSNRAVKIRKLRKIFHEGDSAREVKAVKGLDLDLIEGEILVMLGHNGAGKTTTISMLTGLYPPSTGGDAEIYGKSITWDMTAIRKKFLGVCPQHDILYPQLTVKEHLIMYAKLKGVELVNVENAVTEMIEQVGLTEKVHAAAGTLSGGMKRKLSIGMAFIGNSKVVFLDEPTSGMDPYSRRSTWDLLKHARKGRVIVLTTHFMDEADYLGDRIAIMGKGRLICCGTPLFLKSHYGVGYNMTVNLRSATDATTLKLAQLVKHYVPESSVLSDSAGEIVYRLPIRSAPRFADMFDSIDSDRKSLAIDSYGVSVTTLEEVFLRVGAMDDLETATERFKQKKSMKTRLDITRQQTLREIANKPDLDNAPHTGLSLRALERQQECSLFIPPTQQEISAQDFTNPNGFSSGEQQQHQEQYSPTIPSEKQEQHDLTTPQEELDVGKTPISETPSNGIPVVQSLDTITPEAQTLTDCGWCMLHTYAMVVKRYHNGKRDKRALMCALLLPVGIFLIGTIIAVFTGASPATQFLLSWFSSSGAKPNNYLGSEGKVHTFVNNLQPYNTWESQPDFASDFFQFLAPTLELDPWSVADPFHLSELLLNTSTSRSSDDLRYGAFGLNYIQNSSNIPNASSTDIPYSLVQINGSNYLLNLAVMFNSTVTTSLPVFLNSLSNNFVLRRLKQGLSSVRSISMYQKAFPLSWNQQSQKNAATEAFFLAMAFTWVPASYGSYVVMERESHSKHQQFISGVGPMAYWLAHMLWDLLSFLLPFVVVLIITVIFREKPPVNLLYKHMGAFALTMIIFNISVSMFAYLLSFMFSSSSSAEATLRMIFVVTGPMLMMVDIILRNSDIVTDLENNVLVFIWRLLPTFCFSNSVYNIMILQENGGETPWSMEVTGWNFVYMTCVFFVCLGCVLLLEFVERSAELLQYCSGSVQADSPPSTYENLDDDITNEAKRVHDPSDPGYNTDIIRVLNMRKVYPGRLGSGIKIAVHDLNFGVPPGECFGLLGINGAGKTTTMQMLTADQLPSSGTAYLNGLDIKTEQQEIRKQIGYCPQFDALIGNLTARETLFLYARLKGLPENALPAYVDGLIDRLSLTPFADKPCQGYSGGNKRKLSVGMAMIGSPKILFLDEPSTGMDPKSRRFMWELIAATMIGRSVILTTHAMEEAEALCTRIGIMVGGRLRCLGSSHHLKQKYGAGYQIDINTHEEHRNDIDGWIKDLSSECVLIEAHGGSIKYRLPQNLTLAKMFRLVEANKERLGILEYSLAETSLEQIFIHFARQQEEEKGPVSGLASGQTEETFHGALEKAVSRRKLAAPAMEQKKSSPNIKPVREDVPAPYNE